MTLTYIAGYVERKDDEIYDIYFYYEIYGNYLKDMNCGWFKIPNHAICQLTI